MTKRMSDEEFDKVTAAQMKREEELKGKLSRAQSAAERRAMSHAREQEMEGDN